MARLKESLTRGLVNRRAFLEVRNLSGELARTNQTLPEGRRMLTQCNCNLSGLHQLTQSMANFIETDAVVKEFLYRLPKLIAVDVLGLARTNPEQGWAWSCDHDVEREESVRTQLLAILGHTPQRMTSSHTVLRLVRSVHEIPHRVSPQMPSGSKHGSVSTHKVPLTIGPYGTGILYLERDAEHPFTEQEGQLLAIIGTLLALILHNADSYQRLQDAALQDSLTGVLNHRGFSMPLAQELKAGLRYGVPACLILLDLDFFQTVNDRLGHKIGDQVLKTAADLIRTTVRDSDIVGRYRGNTFAVVLPHTDRQRARALAERLRDRIERHPFAIEAGQVRTTASIGLAAVPDAAVASIAEWMMIGDAALNDAKAQGRNRVVLHVRKPPALACAVALSCAA
ncbi:MAG: diguanylate cyclase/phosphodiesterase (GGDEF & EAL domains) with PAS/PAC sensor(s) [Nitrospira sp.]|nr:MAG: diguanylate cyclase/phosphodiesterase (GGDEF & EAL domains) with PAS/PAC sensor(s) [Nitrospira sp.]